MHEELQLFQQIFGIEEDVQEEVDMQKQLEKKHAKSSDGEMSTS